MKNYKKIDHFEPIAMKCNRKNLSNILPILSNFGFEIKSCDNGGKIIVNNLWGDENVINTLDYNKRNDYKRTYHKTFNKKTFLKACGIVETEPTTKVINSVLLQLAENNSYSEEILKKECPKLFENKLEVGKWYKGSVDFKSLIYITKINNKVSYNEIHYFGFTFGNYSENKTISNSDHERSLVLATPQEVESAFKDLFINLGFVKGKVFKCLDTNREITIKNHVLDFELFETNNVIYIDGFEVFKNGKIAKIIETPTDIITIVEKYGKDKVIKLIEKM